MENAQKIELDALIDKLADEDLALIAGAAFETWCAAKGAGPESVAAFLAGMVEAQEDDETRNALIAALATIRRHQVP